ncbi:hypothetical protein [Flagellimonas sp.]|uniref:hypothetical protein n=1 Tax=Flagellimonas sp. TaxID=2058762 RepID=UPI003BB20C45
MQDLKKIFVFLLFATLMLVKVSALHVYSHQDGETHEIENCAICEIALESQQSNFEITGKVMIPEVNTFFITEEVEFQYQINVPIPSSHFFFSRPPPSAQA